MNLGKSARYALYAALAMAEAESEAEGGLVTVGAVAERYRIPPGALAKVLQQLVRARIASGTRGVGGGYRLARPASKLSALDVIAVFEPVRAPGGCVLAEPSGRACPAMRSCGLHSLLEEVEESTRRAYASVTIEELVRRGRARAAKAAPPPPKGKSALRTLPLVAAPGRARRSRRVTRR